MGLNRPRSCSLVNEFFFALFFFGSPLMRQLDKPRAAPVNDLISRGSARTHSEPAHMLGMMLDLVLHQDRPCQPIAARGQKQRIHDAGQESRFSQVDTS